MHIALVHRDLHQITRGGICTIYRALAPRLINAGHAVTLITQQTPHPVSVTGARLVTLPRTDNPTAHRHAVATALQAIKPDIVDCSTWEAEALTYLGQPRADRAAVIARGDLSAATMGAHDLIEAERAFVQSADTVIAVSYFAASDLAAAYGIAPPVAVPNGVDRALFTPGPVTVPRSGYRVTLDNQGHVATQQALTDNRPIPPWTDTGDPRPRLVWVGKITPMKGWDRLIRISRVLRHQANLTVLLGHAPAFCPAEVTGRDDITIVQDLDDADLPGFYRAADWLLSTSRWEGFGLAIAEAIACGTPALLPTELGTAPELLAADGGYTYTSDDDLTALITDRPKEPARLPERFDWDHNALTSLNLYQEALGRRP